MLVCEEYSRRFVDRDAAQSVPYIQLRRLRNRVSAVDRQLSYLIYLSMKLPLLLFTGLQRAIYAAVHLDKPTIQGKKPVYSLVPTEHDDCD